MLYLYIAEVNLNFKRKNISGPYEIEKRWKRKENIRNKDEIEHSLRKHRDVNFMRHKMVSWGSIIDR